MKLGSINPIIRPDVPSDTSPIDTEMIESLPIFNPNLQEQSQLNYNQESKMKIQKWNRLIADKKSAMIIILNQCNENTKTEIALSSSYKDNLEAAQQTRHTVQNSRNAQYIHCICTVQSY